MPSAHHLWLLLAVALLGDDAAAAAPKLGSTTQIVSAKLLSGLQADTVARATRALANGDSAGAQKILGAVKGPASALVAARIGLDQKNLDQVASWLDRASSEPILRPYVALERGRLALALGKFDQAVSWLEPLWRTQGAIARQAALPLAVAWAQQTPELLLQHKEALLARLSAQDPHAKSRLLGWVAFALEQLKRHDEAHATLMQRFVEEAASSETPKQPPPGAAPTAENLLRRFEILVEKHRSVQAMEALSLLDSTVPPASLAPMQSCRRAYAWGLTARKLHRYSEAEQVLTGLMGTCSDAQLVRRAAFLQAKVISILDGLRALAPIEAFVSKYPDDAYVDDVLFWAGDILQRRGRVAEAKRAYERILALPRSDDQCLEATWRLALLAKEDKDDRAARQHLQTMLKGPCPSDRPAQARALYWLARLDLENKRPKAALRHLRALHDLAPLSFYGQAGYPLLAQLLGPKERRALIRSLHPPVPKVTVAALCPGPLSKQPALAAAIALLERGLVTDAAFELRSLKNEPVSKADTTRCGPAQGSLLVAQLLSLADAPRDAQLRLQRDFATVLAKPPTSKTLAVWQAAYPLAFRPALAAAEAQSHLPNLLLQALAREESRFDPHVVSWAEAYGLTQLLLPSAQQAGRSLRPQVAVPSADLLRDPVLNASLGGALLRLYMTAVDDSPALGLAAYNGGLSNAQQWGKRFAGEPITNLSEGIGIAETRGYVQRVLETFGIYRWLYDGQMPALFGPGKPTGKAASKAKAQNAKPSAFRAGKTSKKTVKTIKKDDGAATPK